MKKMFLMTALAGIALASCTNDVTTVESSSLDSKTIGWQSASYVQSRVDYPITCTFWSAAFVNGDQNKTAYISKSEVKYNSSNQYWSTDTLYYWPGDNKSLDFVSVSPAALTNSELLNMDTDSIKFAYSLSMSDQTGIDQIMYADLKTKLTSSNTTDGKVATIFKNALAKVKVLAVVNTDNNDEKNYTVTVNSMKIRNVYTNGHLTIKSKTESDVTSWDAPEVWNVRYSKQKGDSIDWSIVSQDNVLTTSSFELADKYVIPVTLSDSIKLETVYTVVVYNSSTPQAGEQGFKRVYKKEISMNTIKDSNSNNINAWKLNTYNTYTVSINPSVELKPILWAPEVSDWTNVTGSIAISAGESTLLSEETVTYSSSN